MIVPTMNFDEITAEIQYNDIFIYRKILNLDRKMSRLAIKTKRAVSDFILTKDKSNNNWFIYIISTKKHTRISYGVYYLDQFNKFNVIENVFNDKDTQTTQSLIHYNSHFFDRYNERFLQQENINKLDILKLYVFNNAASSINMDSKDKSQVSVVSDGMCLGYVSVTKTHILIHNKTFINNDMLFKSQQKINSDGKNVVDDCLKPYQKLMEKAIILC